MPYETELNRQLLGLPSVQPRQEPASDGTQGRGSDRNWLLNAAQARGGNVGLRLEMFDTFELGFMHEFVVEDRLEMDEVAIHALDVGDAPDVAANAPAVEAGENGEADGVVAVAEVSDIPINEIPALTDDAAPAPVAPPAALAPAANHEGHPAPARGTSLGAVLFSAVNVIVTALILPGVSFAVGEALRIVLTATPLGNPRRPLAAPVAAVAAPVSFSGDGAAAWSAAASSSCCATFCASTPRCARWRHCRTARVKNVDRPSRLEM